MSDQHNSEQDLFTSSLSDLTPLSQKDSTKRNSLGFKLPINSPTSPPRTFTMSGTDSGHVAKGKGKSSTPSPSGTSVLGFQGYSFQGENPLLLEKEADDGSHVTINLFEDVFMNANLGVAELEKILNYLEIKGKLDFSSFIEGISYQGFDRAYYVKMALRKVSVSVFCRFAILGAVRGSNFQKIKESCLEMPADLSRLVSTGQIVKTATKRDDMTILRFTACLPHWVAFWLFSVDIPKKMDSEDCPGWLQFPGAASLPMGKKVRMQHISFCKAFSALLPGGEFKGTIYYTAYSNPILARDVPKMIKEHLGIGDTAGPGDEITSTEVQELVISKKTKK
jgi:hypothetical protein